MKLYNFTSAEYGLKNIAKRRLKVSRINELNDPFELRGVDLSHKQDRDYFSEFKNDYNDSAGIICFSGNWENPVHWSHYADNHKGICLGFEIPENSVTKINYSDDFLPFDRDELVGDEEEQIKFLAKLTTTKFKHWSYEDEYRKTAPLNECNEETGLYFIDFADDLILTEVIIGSQSEVTTECVKNALGDLSDEVECIKARLAFKKFKVTEHLNYKPSK